MIQNKFDMILWISLCFLWISCNRPGNDDFSPDNTVEVRLSADTLYAASVNNTVDLRIINRNEVQKLVINKQDSKGITMYKNIQASDLPEIYAFTYQPNDSDEERFYFIFQAQNANNKVLASKSLPVETRYGIIVSGLTKISRMTGKTLSGESIVNPNRTDERYNVGGTDLGIIWDMENGSYGLIFGDTYGKSFVPVPGGGPGPAGDWRSNILAFSNDTDLDDGLSFSGMAVDNSGYAREIAYSAKNTSGNGDYTSIPTAAIHADGVDYLHYMNIRTWTGWVTNYSALYASGNHGETWRRCSEVIFQSNSPFGQVAFAKKDGYVYMMGTPTGRDGSACLARIPEKLMLKQADYEYWNSGQGWVKGNEALATVIIDGKVGEASLMYHRKFGRWIFTYLDPEEYALCYRDAPDITGPWTKEKILVKSTDYPALYGSFMHPAKDAGDKLYFTMSQWGPYNVFLMRVDLKCIK
jgi:hypothetical protein